MSLFIHLGFLIQLELSSFAARVFMLGLSQSGFSNSAWAFVARVFLSRLHHKQQNTPTNTPSLQRGRPRRVLPIPIVQVARGEEARWGSEAVYAAPTAGGQREALLTLLQQILDWQGTSPGFFRGVWWRLKLRKMERFSRRKKPRSRCAPSAILIFIKLIGGIIGPGRQGIISVNMLKYAWKCIRVNRPLYAN